jgi:AcrR family transcriptional regulator
MEGRRNPSPRRYRAPQREAAAAKTRERIVRGAVELFERRGWAGTSMRLISETAGVSQKTVEAAYRTKAGVLRAAVDYAIRGDIDPRPMPQRDAVLRMESAADAETMLNLHATQLRNINERSAWIARAVEEAAPSDVEVAKLWQQMNANRAYAIRWATDTYLSKAGRRRGIARAEIEAAFWVALDWGTYRTLTEQAHRTADQFEQWLRWYYHATLLDRHHGGRASDS